MSIDMVLEELAYQWGVPLSIEQGAIQITSKDGSEWFLECPQGAEVLTIHASLDVKPSSEKECRYWLGLNTQRSKLGFSWIGLNKGVLCLGVSLPVDGLDAAKLNNLFDNLFELRESLLKTREY